MDVYLLIMSFVDCSFLTRHKRCLRRVCVCVCLSCCCCCCWIIIYITSRHDVGGIWVPNSTVYGSVRHTLDLMGWVSRNFEKERDRESERKISSSRF